MSKNPPFRTKLLPYLAEIRDLRQRRKTYPQIADVLLERHGLKVAPSTIFSAVKVRSRREGPYALSTPAAAHPNGNTSAIEKLRHRADLSTPAGNPLAILLSEEPLIKLNK